MKKLIHTAAYLAVILTVISAFFGCKTTGAAVAKTAEEQVVDWQGKDVNAAIPAWTAHTSETAWFENLPEFKDKYVMAKEENGRDLDSLKVWAQTQASAQIALQVQQRITAKLGDHLKGQKDDPTKQKLVKEIDGAVTKLTISGFRNYQSFWTKKRLSSGDFQYHYYVVYTIDKNKFHEQMDKILGTVSAKDEKEKEALEELNEVLRDADAFFK